VDGELSDEPELLAAELPLDGEVSSLTEPDVPAPETTPPELEPGEA
jgi:hypothetical protein